MPTPTTPHAPMDRTIRFVTEHGYKPVFLQDGFLGGPK
jgi:hypothetical protein